MAKKETAFVQIKGLKSRKTLMNFIEYTRSILDISDKLETELLKRLKSEELPKNICFTMKAKFVGGFILSKKV